MLNRLIIILLLLAASKVYFAQEIPIGDWRDHLPYSDAVSVTYGDKIVYCATNSAIFTYNEENKTIDRLSLVNGLSDIGISKIKFNDYNKRVIIAYLNGNLDIIDENKNISNLSFIKNSNVVGSKSINHIYLKGKLAYLSTGFGIVVLDTDELEIVDTYLFGPLGNYIVTNSVTMDDTNIYAATDQGVYFADKNNPNLIDYNVWSSIATLGTLKYSNIVSFANRLFVSYDDAAYEADTLYYNDSGIWQKFPANAVGQNIHDLSVSNNHLISVSENLFTVYDDSLNFFQAIYSFNNQFSITPLECIMKEDNYYWVADKNNGLIKTIDNLVLGEIIVPNGPSSPNVFNMDFFEDELWLVSGGYGIGLQEKLINHSSNGTWGNFSNTMLNSQGMNARDMVSVAINPGNKNNVYVGSWKDGLFEYNNGAVTNIYTVYNSVLDSVISGVNVTAIGALEFDADNNLWAVSSFAKNILAVKTINNNWYSYDFPGKTEPGEEYHNLLIDQNNYKWILSIVKNRILVFDDNGTLDNTNDDRSVLNNNFSGGRIQSIVEDLDGEIWIGTDQGISVFYNPSNVFDENIKAEQIYIQQDGQTQVLLETEVATVIAVDGANRKWVGTQNSGVYLLSEDGTEQIEHFTIDNSPLFSNNIFDITINPKTGEVYFGTAKGLISYKGTATDADSDFNNVFVYPNPVKPGFNGTIAIRGLVKDTDVRITDISGNIVYQTTSLGGQAVWDGKDFNGNKVQTGVYMVFNGSPDGNLKAAAKILFIN